MHELIISHLNLHSSALILEDVLAFNPLSNYYKTFGQAFEQLTPGIQQSYYGQKALKRLQKRAGVDIGKSFKEFNYVNIQGTSGTLSSQLGKPILLEFWASWCGPCIAQMPYLEEVYEEYRSKGFQVFAISRDQDPKQWKAMIPKITVPFTHILDQDETIANLYQVTGIPDNFLINSEGEIVGRDLTHNELREELKKLFDQ